MKPAWDKLMKNWNKGERMKTSVIADVDCTAEGKPLCEEHGVKGFPTIKWGDPTALETYEGGRDYDALKKWSKANLKPMCSVANIDLCDDEKKAEIAKFQALEPEKLTEAIEAKEKEVKTAEETFEAEVKKLQDTYSTLQKDKDDTIAEIKKKGLGLMKAVLASKKPKKEDL